MLPRQSRLHFVKERDDRKGKILNTVTGLPVRISLYDAGRLRDGRAARRLCLERIVADLAALSAHRLVIEQDDSLVRSDQETLYRAVRRTGVESTLVYEHMSPRLEPLLWVGPRRGRVELGEGRELARTTRDSGARRPGVVGGAPRQREARLTHRPEGCRAHFIGANAPCTSRLPRSHDIGQARRPVDVPSTHVQPQ